MLDHDVEVTNLSKTFNLWLEYLVRKSLRISALNVIQCTDY